jgi:hypothetical protein
LSALVCAFCAVVCCAQTHLPRWTALNNGNTVLSQFVRCHILVWKSLAAHYCLPPPASVCPAAAVLAAMSAADAATGEFVEARCRLTIHLHPSRLANVREGVEEQLNAHVMKSVHASDAPRAPADARSASVALRAHSVPCVLFPRYVDALGGVLISYSDLTLSSDPLRNPFGCGFIFQERSFIHFDVSVRALTWRCAAGARYEGVVNAVAADHLSVLLHGIFTATIPLSAGTVPRGWVWDAERERWLDTNVWSEAKEQAEQQSAAAAAAVKDEEGSDDEGAAEAAAAAGKKLSKKELKKLERKKLRAVMLAAQGRTGGNTADAVVAKAPSAGVVSRGVHVRFECTLVQHSDEGYLKLTGALVPHTPAAKSAKSEKDKSKHADQSPLGLTGRFTPLAPLEGSPSAANAAAGAADAEQEQLMAKEEDIDMEAIAAVTAFTPAPAARTKTAAPMPTPIAAAPAVPTPAAAPAPTAAPPKQLSAGQLERAAKKKAKLAERMAAKGITPAAGAGAKTNDDDGDDAESMQSPAKKQKKSGSSKLKAES